MKNNVLELIKSLFRKDEKKTVQINDGSEINPDFVWSAKHTEDFRLAMKKIHELRNENDDK